MHTLNSFTELLEESGLKDVSDVSCRTVQDLFQQTELQIIQIDCKLCSKNDSFRRAADLGSMGFLQRQIDR